MIEVDVDFVCRGVAVHHEPFILAARLEKLAADPAEVVVGLIVEADAGADAGVHEYIVAELQQSRARAEKVNMLARDTLCHQVGEILE